MSKPSVDSFKCLKQLKVGSKTYSYYDLNVASKNGLGDVSKLPFSLKVLLENLLRHEDGTAVKKDDIAALADWLKNKSSTQEVAFYPARVLMQDFTGVPAVVDLAAMRVAMKKMGGDPTKINPLTPVDLVIDHSVMVDYYGTPDAFDKNVSLEFERNRERYELLKWAQKAFNNFRAVPPGTGICHQVNLEYLARTVWTREENGATWAYPDTVVGTDSHTTMINGVAVLGWGVGGIEAEAAMLRQPVTMVIPDVIGFKFTGELKEGVTATDLVLTAVEMLRKKGVVGKFVEYYGPGLKGLSLADRATIANMAPEYGATCGFFPIDQETISYLKFSGRDDDTVALVEAYAKAQSMWLGDYNHEPVFTDTLHLDLSTVQPCLAGPKRPQDRVSLSDSAVKFSKALTDGFKVEAAKVHETSAVKGTDYAVGHGSVVIAAITSCTNTSNPSVLIAAGLVAKKAVERGLKVKPWVKTSLAPGSQVVTDYLAAAGLQNYLDQAGFNLVGYGCTTCIGNSGPLLEVISEAIHAKNLIACSVLSGNRNFEGRVNPDVQANYLASPPLVVAYAFAGSMNVDLSKDPIGKGKDGKDVFLKDIWPSNAEVKDTLTKSLGAKMFRDRYANVFKGPKQWQEIKTSEGFLFTWDEKSTYIKHPPYFEGMQAQPAPLNDIAGARALAVLGDSVTTDHISPAGSIKEKSPAGQFLISKGVTKADFNSYGARRGNDEVMMRGTFGNIRIKNEMVPGVEGPYTMYEGQQVFIYDAAVKYAAKKTPLVIVAGKEYGTGSSRDWAAKGTLLLGVRAVICESFERIHRSNLLGMGVLPLEFTGGATRHSIGIKGTETFDIKGVASGLKPRAELDCLITFADGKSKTVKLKCRIDTEDELQYFKNGGILQYVLRRLG